MEGALVPLALLALLAGAGSARGDIPLPQIARRDLLASGDRFAAAEVDSFGPLLFDVARDQLFVGARDNLLRLSLRGLRQLERAPWPAPRDKVQLCQDKGQSERACRNYVRVLLSDGARLFACGTSAFAPACSWRALFNVSAVLDWVPGVAKCPYDPRANVTALLTEDGQYYAGTPTDFSGSDFALYRTMGGGLALRTSQYNSKWLNEPQFVGSFEDDKFVYFIFREAAVEYMNCGKRVYSRIARVCKNDAGGDVVLRENWTTFVKARLNCSEPGEYPFYYDEVQSIEYLPQRRLLYAAFATPSNALSGSAVCVYNMSAVEDAFRGPFKHQDSPGSAWEARSGRSHEAAACADARARAGEAARYQLLDRAVQPARERPLLTVRGRMTHLAVAPPALYVASQDGALSKVRELPGGGSCALEEWRLELGAPLRALHYLRETDSIYLATDVEVLRIAASHCGRWSGRAACLGARDPHCGWDERRELCTTAPPAPRPHWLQDPPGCPEPRSAVDGGWSSWSPWEECLQSGGGGVGAAEEDESGDRCLCQSRACDSPVVRGDGRACAGARVRVANCTLHGAWTAWSGWSACSASCGVAVKWRRRSCGAPAPAHGGRLCVGPDRQEVYCTQNPPCPVPVEAALEASWGEWGAWAACSAPCGGGVRWRSRACDRPPPPPGGAPCAGCATQTEPCNTQPCDAKRASAWTPWIPAYSNSSEQSVIEKRYKFSCKVQSENLKISLSKEEERPWGGAGGGERPLCAPGWGCWGDWSECSASCGAGSSWRRRPCLLPGGCAGARQQTRHCRGPPCHELAGWGAWSAWSACDGGSEQRRERRCMSSTPCVGPDMQTRFCTYDDDDTDNELHAMAARRPEAEVLLAGGGGGGGGWAPLAGALLGGLLGGAGLALLALHARRRRRARRLPSSPHYITQQNSYVSVPLKEVPKKRQPSFSGTSHGGYCPAKANNLNSDRGTPKLYPKAIAGDYEAATMKRNSHAPLRNNINLEQEKFN